MEMQKHPYATYKLAEMNQMEFTKDKFELIMYEINKNIMVTPCKAQWRKLYEVG